MEKLPHLPHGIAAFKALGNAVNVTVVDRILRNLLRLLAMRRDSAAVEMEWNGQNILSNRRRTRSPVVAQVLA
jgi:hypothetical protein